MIEATRIQNEYEDVDLVSCSFEHLIGFDAYKICSRCKGDYKVNQIFVETLRRDKNLIFSFDIVGEDGCYGYMS